MPNDTTSLSLRNQRAIVTGSSSGIGAAIAEALAAAGASVAVNYSHSEAEGKEVTSAIEKAGGRAILVRADVSQEADVLRMFQETVSAFGGVDILVNNAGLQKDARLVDMTLSQWNTVIGINLTGQFLCAREAIRQFIKQGIDATRSVALGKIIAISSVHDVIPWAGHANYAASKGGVSMLMKTLAHEHAQLKVRVNAISPGAIKTHINRDAWSTPAAEQELLKLIPYGRVGDPSDIGKAAVWLASDDSDYVNGATLYVDGGMTLYPEFRGNG